MISLDGCNCYLLMKVHKDSRTLYFLNKIKGYFVTFKIFTATNKELLYFPINRWTIKVNTFVIVVIFFITTDCYVLTEHMD